MIAGQDLANVVAESTVSQRPCRFSASANMPVPIAAMLVWILVIRGTYRQDYFSFACVLYLSYVFSAPQSQTGSSPPSTW
jgi:hypothetical protein